MQMPQWSAGSQKPIHTKTDEDEFKFTLCKSSSLEAKNTFMMFIGRKASHAISLFFIGHKDI